MAHLEAHEIAVILKVCVKAWVSKMSDMWHASEGMIYCSMLREMNSAYGYGDMEVLGDLWRGVVYTLLREFVHDPDNDWRRLSNVIGKSYRD